MKVLLLTAPMPPAALAAHVAALAPEVTLLEYGPELDDEALAGVEAVLGWNMPVGLAPRLPRLRWICSVAAGVEKLLPHDLAPHVTVSRTIDDEQAEGIGQFVVTMALRHARSVEHYEMQQRQQLWRRVATPLATHRVAVLGTGAMGTAIVAWLNRVGLRASGWNRRSPATLHETLAASEIVVCALPLTESTADILDAAAFAAMPPGSYLVNVARGQHVVDADLIAAVRSGHLAGAALDVQRREPMPADDPLWSVPGITITPHIAAQSSPLVIARQFVASLRSLEGGDGVINAIDRARGY